METQATIKTPRFIVMTSSANMPSRCWGIYRNVAVVKLEAGFQGRPAMISSRAIGVEEIVHFYGPCNVGKTSRCAYQRMLAAAQQEADKLNAEMS